MVHRRSSLCVSAVISLLGFLFPAANQHLNQSLIKLRQYYHPAALHSSLCRIVCIADVALMLHPVCLNPL